MGFFLFGLLKFLIRWAIYLVVFIAIVTLIPNLPPYTTFTSIQLEDTLPMEGTLKTNGLLNNAEKLYKDKLAGPEGLQLYNGEVYTSLASGEIVKLSPGGHITFVTKLGQPCEGLGWENKCGRPLGFVIDEINAQLYVADGYYGIWQVDLKTGKKKQLVSPDTEIEGRKPMLFNSIALAKNGDLYWTDSSSDFHLNKGAKTMLADPSGRLLHYNSKTKKSKVLVDNLWFANGVVISPDEQYVVVSETTRYRLVKHYVAGPKKGQTAVLLPGLPGVPDNLKPLPDGSGFLVALYAVFPEDEPFLAKSLAATPVVRKFLARLIELLELPIELINKFYTNPSLEKLYNSIGGFESLSGFIPKRSGLLVVSWDGQILESYYNTDGSLAHISDAVVYKDKLLTGSPHSQNYVGAVPAPPLLKKAFASVQKAPAPKTAETVTKPIPKKAEKQEVPKATKPMNQTPKPTEAPTTTPKPTTTTHKPTTTTPKPTTTTPKPTTTTPKPTTTTPKPTTTTPKPTTTTPKTTTTTPKTTTPKPATTTPPPKKAETKDQKVTSKPTPEPKKSESKQPTKEKPIVEEIPSDTIKPTKEKLKVIKREGPAEIPNPEL